jgi:hypothetical protein
MSYNFSDAEMWSLMKMKSEFISNYLEEWIFSLFGFLRIDWSQMYMDNKCMTENISVTWFEKSFLKITETYTKIHFTWNNEYFFTNNTKFNLIFQINIIFFTNFSTFSNKLSFFGETLALKLRHQW